VGVAGARARHGLGAIIAPAQKKNVVRSHRLGSFGRCAVITLVPESWAALITGRFDPALFSSSMKEGENKRRSFSLAMASGKSLEPCAVCSLVLKTAHQNPKPRLKFEILIFLTNLLWFLKVQFSFYHKNRGCIPKIGVVVDITRAIAYFPGAVAKLPWWLHT